MRELSNLLQEKKLDFAWLGLYDIFQEGDWVTISDQPLAHIGYINWTIKWPNTRQWWQ